MGFRNPASHEKCVGSGIHLTDHHFHSGLEKIRIEVDHGLDVHHPAHIKAVFNVPDVEIWGDVPVFVHLVLAEFQGDLIEFSGINAIMEKALVGRNIFCFDVNMLRDGESFDKIAYSRVRNTL